MSVSHITAVTKSPLCVSSLYIQSSGYIKIKKTWFLPPKKKRNINAVKINGMENREDSGETTVNPAGGWGRQRRRQGAGDRSASERR